MSPSRKVFWYSAGIALGSAVLVWWGGKPVEPARLVWAALMIPFFFFAIWLKWDWGPGEGRKLHEDRERRREEWLKSRRDSGK